MKPFPTVLATTLLIVMVSGQNATLPATPVEPFANPGEILPGLTIPYLINAAGSIWQQDRVIDSMAYACRDVLPYLGSVVPRVNRSSLYWGPICDEVIEASNDLDAFEATGWCDDIITMITNLTSQGSDGTYRRQAGAFMEYYESMDDPLDNSIDILINITRDLYGIDIYMIFNDTSTINTICTNVKENFLRPSLQDLISQFGAEFLSALLPRAAPLCQDWDGFLRDLGINSTSREYPLIQDTAHIGSQAVGYDSREELCQAITQSLSVQGDNGEARRSFSTDLILSVFEIPTNAARCSMLANGTVYHVIKPAFGIVMEITDEQIYQYTGFQGPNPLDSLCTFVENDFTDMNNERNLTAEEILENLRNTEITSDNAEVVAEELEKVTSMGQDISIEGLNIVAVLLEDINGKNSTKTKVAESILEIADNIAALPDEQLGMAEEENSSPSRVVLALEAQLAIVEVENGSSRFAAANIAAEVLDVNPADISHGYTFFTTVTNDYVSISQEPEATQSQATLSIPSGLADRFPGRRGRLVITTYRVSSLFHDTGIAHFNHDVEEVNRTLNSRIISASINNEKVENLSEPVRISFTPVNPNGTNAQCVFWDFDEKAWSQRGCFKTSNDSSDRIECECNHLTNFGVIMDIYGGEHLPDDADFILEIISYVGCLISILGLILTILTYATNKKLRDRKPNQILISLSCALLGLYVVFLVMISVDTERDVTEVSPLPCAILAAFLQYFILAAIFWMAVEGFNMHNLFVLVLNAYFPRFMAKASLIAWGCPLLIVGITAGVSRQYYAQTDFCFPALWPLIGGLLIPIGVVMIFNFAIYVRVLIRLNKTMKGRHLDKTEKRQRIRRFQNAVCILILMGLTWSLGYLSIIQPASAVVQGIFTVLNSLQGFFIFMLYCVRQPQVHTIWRSQFKCCLPKSFTTPSAVSSGSGLNTSAIPDTRLVSDSDSSRFRPETVSLTLPERLPRGSDDNAGAEW